MPKKGRYTQSEIAELQLQYDGARTEYLVWGEKAKGTPEGSIERRTYERVKDRYLLCGQHLADAKRNAVGSRKAPSTKK